MAFQTPEERNRWMPHHLALHNERRCHLAFGGLSPQRRQAVLRAE
jgi:hypothetical protein